MRRLRSCPTALACPSSRGLLLVPARVVQPGAIYLFGVAMAHWEIAALRLTGGAWVACVYRTGGDVWKTEGKCHALRRCVRQPLPDCGFQRTAVSPLRQATRGEGRISVVDCIVVSPNS